MASLTSFHWQDLRLESTADFILVAICLLIIRNIITRTLRWYRLRHIPGPALCGWTSLWLTWQYYRGTIQYRTEDFFEKYGPIVRIGPNEIMCFDPDEVRRIMSLKSGYTKDRWYKAGQVHPSEENTMSILDPDTRKHWKKKLLPAYAGKGTANFESCIDIGLGKWLESVAQRYAAKEVDMDLSQQVHFAALDTLGEIALGQPLGFVENNADQGDFLKINETMLPILLSISNYSPVFKLMSLWPLKYLLPRAGDKVGLGAVLSFAQGIIDERLKPDAKPNKDMLQVFINSGLGHDQLLSEVGLQFIAGSDSTANTITLTLFHLLTNPGKYQKLREEVDPVSSHGPNDIIPDSVAKNLPYLQACIREALRIQTPVASGPFHKAVPPGGDTLCGKHLPYGTRVSTNGAVYAIGRAKAYWGADAKVFRPERWLEADAATKQRMVDMVDLTWGAGAFVCPGKAIGLIEAGKAVAEVVRRFDISLVNPDEPAHFRSALVWLIHDFLVRVEYRKN
ncbi:cytochrome P450 [Podospora conica]|nr:cytochrome P450 [Schizothecium conicum]